MLNVSSLRKGLKILHNDEPHVVVEFQFVKPGKGQALYKCRLRNLVRGTMFDISYRSSDRLSEADVEERRKQFLYKSEDDYIFMDLESFEQFAISGEVLGDDAGLLTDNLEVDVLLWNGRPIGVTLPNFVEIEVTECEPGVRGDTATGATKSATLSTGAVISVPLFVNQGDVVRVDTRNNSYVSRVR